MPLAPGRLLGGYEVVGLIGSGGMGEVYQARHTRLPRMAAIKFVSDELAADPKAADRLEREARLTSALNHPNIVTVFDIGEDAGRPYIVMEFVAGRSLHDRLASGALPQKQAVDIACQVADGLAAAHEAGVVHRDLKPRNIMVSDEGRVKIVDFGLGRTAKAPALPDDETVRTPEMTDEHVVMGTAGYMAPEQALGHAFDFRADQFALGVVIYEMITGQRAFKRESARHMQAAVIEAEPRPMAELCPAVHPELVTLVERCLEKNPSDRYASTKDLARDLHDVHAAMTHRSAPMPPPRPVPRWVRPVLLAVGALVAAVTAAVLWWPGETVDPLNEGRRHLYRFDRPQDLEAAVTFLRVAVDADSQNPVAHAALAEALWRQYEQPLPPDDTLAEKARAQISEALRLAGDRHGYPLVVQAMMSLGTNSGYVGAEEAARRAIVIEPLSSEAHRELGRALERLGKAADAEAALKQAVALAPEDWRPLNYLAGFYLGRLKLDEADGLLHRALSLTPDNTKVYNNIGTSHYHRGLQQGETPEGFEKERAEFVLAEAAWQQSNALSPNAPAYSNLGTLSLQRQAFTDAVRNFEHAVRLSKRSFTPLRNLASALWFAPGQRERARTVYGEAIAIGERERALRPKDDGLLAELASAYAVTGRTEEARNIIAELEAMPNLRPGTKYTLGSTFEILGEREKALALLGSKKTKQIERSPWLEELRKDPRYGR